MRGLLLVGYDADLGNAFANRMPDLGDRLATVLIAHCGGGIGLADASSRKCSFVDHAIFNEDKQLGFTGLKANSECLGQ